MYTENSIRQGFQIVFPTICNEKTPISSIQNTVTNVLPRSTRLTLRQSAADLFISWNHLTNCKKKLSVFQIKDQSYQYIHIFSLFRCDPLFLNAYQCFKCIKVTSCILTFDFLNKSCSLTRTVHLQIIIHSSFFKYKKHYYGTL